jgi:hypothetical protein
MTPTATWTPTETPLPWPDNSVIFDLNRYPQNAVMCENPLYNREHCWSHVSLVELYNALGQRFPTNRELLRIIVWSEYTTTLGVRSWPNEAIARRYFNQPAGCGENGCQGDEVYEFLEYYSAAINQKLDGEYLEIQTAPQYLLNYLNENISEIVNGPLSWRFGVLSNTPYGFANTSASSSNSCPSSDEPQVGLCVRLSYCNEERYAEHILITSNTYSIFFGTTITKDRKTIQIENVGSVFCGFQ